MIYAERLGKEALADKPWLFFHVVVVLTAVALPAPAQGACTSEYFYDTFGSRSYSLSGGTLHWTGDWIEVDSDGGAQWSGHVRTSSTPDVVEMDNLDDDPEVSIRRQASFVDVTSASLTFQWEADGDLESVDSIVAEIKRVSDGSYHQLVLLSGFNNDDDGTTAVGIPSQYLGHNVVLRFRIEYGFRGSDEVFELDWVRIDVTYCPNPCGSDPCQNGGTCTSEGAGAFSCNCAAGYEGTTCATDTDECASDPCQNGGTCVDGVNGYSCNCAAGYEGTNCTMLQSCPQDELCENYGTCQWMSNHSVCHCPPGYSGDRCQIDIDECNSSPCVHGECVDLPGLFTCHCHQGMTGQLCDVDIDECSSEPCQNGGTCINNVGSFACHCVEGYRGSLCESRLSCATLGSLVKVDEESKLRDLAQLECTTLPGTLRIQDLNFRQNSTLSSLLRRALQQLAVIEGALLVDNTTGFALEALSTLELVAAEETHVAAEAAGREWAIVFTNNKELQVTSNATLDRLFDASASGGLLIDTTSLDTGCLSLQDVSRTGSAWWLDESADVSLRFQISAGCTSCPFFESDNGRWCSTRCESASCQNAKICRFEQPVTSRQQLSQHTDQPCTILDGPLILSGVGTTTNLLESDLAALSTVETVFGSIFVLDSPGVIDLSFLLSLKQARGLVLSGNVMLLNATISGPAAAAIPVQWDELALVTHSCDVPWCQAQMNISATFNAETVAQLDQVRHSLVSAAHSLGSITLDFDASGDVPSTPDSFSANLTCHGPAKEMASLWAALMYLPQSIRFNTHFNASASPLNALADLLQDSSPVTVTLASRSLNLPVLLSLEATHDVDAVTIRWTSRDDEIRSASSTLILSYKRVVPNDALVELKNEMAQFLRADELALLSQVEISSLEVALGSAFSWVSLPPIEPLSTISASVPRCNARRQLSHEPSSGAGCMLSEQSYNLRGEWYDYHPDFGLLKKATAWASVSLPEDASTSSWTVRTTGISSRGFGILVEAVRPELLQQSDSLAVMLTVLKVLQEPGNAVLTDEELSEAPNEEILSQVTKERAVVRLGGSVTASVASFSGSFISTTGHGNNNQQMLYPYSTYVVEARQLETSGRPSLGFRRFLVRTTAEAPRDPPRYAAAVSSQARQAQIETTWPAQPRGPVTSWRIRLCGSPPPNISIGIEEPSCTIESIPTQADSRRQYLLKNETQSVALTSLLPHTRYEVQLAAVTSAGAGPYTQPITLNTPEDIPGYLENPVTSMSAHQDGTRSLTVSWSALSDHSTRTPVYEVEMVLNTANSTSKREAAQSSNGDGNTMFIQTTNTSTTISSEHTLRASAVRVRAISGAGAGPWTDYVSVDSQKASGGPSDTFYFVAGGAASFVVILIAGFIAGAWYRKRRAKELYLFKLEGADEFEVPRHDIVLGEELGAGKFGKVYSGTAVGLFGSDNVMRVAVKEARADGSVSVKAKNLAVKHFYEEMKIMKRLSCPPHPNVVRLMGQVTESTPMLMLLELMPHGDLRSFLMERRATENNPPGLSMAQLLQMCVDMARGMEFVERCDIIHRDLACRNCLVDKTMTIKIADFGQSIVLDQKSVYVGSHREDIPVRWSPPEVLQASCYSHASDVWSLAVAMWEVMSWGTLPYPGLSNAQVEQAIKAAQPLAQPVTCPDGVYRLMQEMWTMVPEARPTFTDVRVRLADMHERTQHGNADVDLIASPWLALCRAGNDGELAHKSMRRNQRGTADYAALKQQHLNQTWVEYCSDGIVIHEEIPTAVESSTGPEFVILDGTGPSNIRRENHVSRRRKYRYSTEILDSDAEDIPGTEDELEASSSSQNGVKTRKDKKKDARKSYIHVRVGSLVLFDDSVDV